MADPKQQQYLSMTFAGSTFLLPGTTGFTIEQRENLTVNEDSDGNASAWRVVRNDRFPAYALDGHFQVVRRVDWERAVFVDSTSGSIGVIVDDVHLLARAQAQVAPFTPLGTAPTSVGPLFGGAWISENGVALVLDPNALVAYLEGLGD